MRVWRMRTGISIIVSPADRGRLQALVKGRNTPQKHAWRAAILLLTAEGLGTIEIMRRTGKSKTCVWRWQGGFMEEGFAGCLRDKPGPSGIAPLGAAVVERVVALTLIDPPTEATHWTGAMMAKATGISVSAVQAAGVGYYPARGGGFVHIDSGQVRHWPGIGTTELAKIFAAHSGSGAMRDHQAAAPSSLAAADQNISSPPVKSADRPSTGIKSTRAMTNGTGTNVTRTNTKAS